MAIDIVAGSHRAIDATSVGCRHSRGIISRSSGAKIREPIPGAEALDETHKLTPRDFSEKRTAMRHGHRRGPTYVGRRRGPRRTRPSWGPGRAELRGSLAAQHLSSQNNGIDHWHV
jgi:hypothetical protein